MLEVGGVFAKLGAKLDDSGFNAYERRLDSARRDARNDVEAELKTDVDSRGFDRYNRDLNRAESSTKRSTGRMGSLMKGAGLAIASGAAVGGAAAAILGKKMIDSATAINESLSKNKVLFGDHADAIDKWSETTASGFGISREAALEATGTFGNLFTALEIGPGKAANMSKSLTELAADMASFNNASPEEALEAIRSGLVGETEPLRKFGVNLNDATLRTQALHMGLVKSTTEALDPQTKALAVNALLFKQTEKAQGDFHRTSGGLANQQRILKAQLSDVGSELGAKLLPIATKVVTGFNDLISGGGKAGGAMDKVKNAASGVGDVFGAIAGGVRSFVNANSDAISGIGDNFKRAFGIVTDLLGGIGKAFGEVFGGGSGIGRDLTTIGGFLLDFYNVVQKVYLAVAERALPGIITAFKGVAQVIRGVVRIITGILTLDFGKVMSGLGDLVGGPLKIVGGLFRAATAAPREFASFIGRAIGHAIGFIAELPVKAARFLVDLVKRWVRFNIDIRKRAFEGAKDAVAAVIDFIAKLPGRMGNLLGDAVRKVVGFAKDVGRAAIDAGKNLLSNVIDRARKLPGDLWDAIKGAFQKLGQFERDIGRAAVDAGKNLVSSIIGVVRDLPGKMADVAGNVVDRFVTGISKLPGRVKSAITGVGGFISDIGSAIADWVNDNTIMGDPVHIGIPGPIPDINFNLPSLATGGKPGNVGPSHGGARLFIAGEGNRDEWVISQEGDRRKNIQWAKDALETLTGREVSLFAGGGTPSASTVLTRMQKRKKYQGIGGYDSKIETNIRKLGQLERYYDQSEEEYLVENKDGDLVLNQAGIDKRVGEINELVKFIRNNILAVQVNYQRAAGAGAKAYKATIHKLTKALGFTGKKRLSDKERKSYKKAIKTYTARRGDLLAIKGELGLDITDTNLDIGDLTGERSAIQGTTAPAPYDSSSTDTDTDTDTSTDTGTPAPAAPTALEIATAAAQQMATFQANRRDLFANYGANVIAANRFGSAFASELGQSAGTAFFGAAEGAFGAGGGDTIVNQTINIGGTSTDEMTFAQRSASELRTALG